MKIRSYKEAVKYLESFIGKVIFKVDPEYLKHHDPLERMRVLLSLLDNPQNKFKSILVAGTSGKGSTAYIISHILKTAGYKTGLTISPHLQKINERLQINNKPISDDNFVKLLKSSILPSIRQMSKMKVGAPSYFEILIAMAFLYFAQNKVDIAVVEVGMGGEFDATNTLYPLVAVLTNVSLDHTNVLGKTVEKIAKTKAGIIKKNQESRIKNQEEESSCSSIIHDSPFMIRPIVVTGVKQPSVIKIVEDKCKEVGAELYRLHKDFDFKIRKESVEGSVFDFYSSSDQAKPESREVFLGSSSRLSLANARDRSNNNIASLFLSLLGGYQVENASLAVKTVLELREFGFKISEESIKKALKTAFFPGRFEIINIARGPAPTFPPASARSIFSLRSAGELRAVGIPSSRVTPRNSSLLTINSKLILDGAHNPTKMKEFLKSLKKLFPKERKIFIIGFKFDKDIPKMLKEIMRVADKIIITEFKTKTDMSVSASAKAESIRYKVLGIKYNNVSVEKDSKKALQKALKIITMEQWNNGTIVITGSIYLVGEIRSML